MQQAADAVTGWLESVDKTAASIASQDTNFKVVDGNNSFWEVLIMHEFVCFFSMELGREGEYSLMLFIHVY